MDIKQLEFFVIACERGSLSQAPTPEWGSMLKLPSLPLSAALICWEMRDVLDPVKGVSFSVKQGERLGIFGESGSGKSMSMEPSLLIADEPTTAIDAITQFDILNEFAAIKQKHKTAMLFISHDLNVVSRIADKIVVLNQGIVVD